MIQNLGAEFILSILDLLCSVVTGGRCRTNPEGKKILLTRFGKPRRCRVVYPCKQSLEGSSKLVKMKGGGNVLGFSPE